MIEVHGDILIAQVLTFLAAATVVWLLGWKPLRQFAKDRQASISQALEQAEQAKASVAKLEADYQVRLKEIEGKAQEAMQLARTEALKAREELLQQAQEEAAALRKKNFDQLGDERKAVMGELRNEITRLSLVIAEKVVAQTIDKSTHDRCVQDLLSSVDSGLFSNQKAAV